MNDHEVSASVESGTFNDLISCARGSVNHSFKWVQWLASKTSSYVELQSEDVLDRPIY